MTMQINIIRRYFDSAISFKKQVESMTFMIDMIEQDLKEILGNKDFEKLPTDTQESLVVPKVRAIRYWRTQLEDYKDKHLSALINATAHINSEELKVTLEEIKELYGRSDEQLLQQLLDSSTSTTSE